MAAARAAFPGWSAATPAERSAHLDRLHAALAARADDLARTIAVELGSPLKLATRVQVGLPLTVLRDHVALAARAPVEESVGNSLVVREPIGVVGAITPWNYPLHQVMAKLAPALAAGCTVVLKPSELTPLTAYLLFDAVNEAGLPPGVLNLVPGTGPVVGEAIAAHPDVDLVSFTGSTATGARIMRLAADRIARVALELGGKSANVILADADLATRGQGGRRQRPAQLRADLHRLDPDAGAPRPVRRGPRPDRHGGGRLPARRPVRPGAPGSARWSPPPSASGCAATSTGPSPTAPGWSPADPTRRCPTRGHFVAPTVFADVRPRQRARPGGGLRPGARRHPVRRHDEAVAIANNSKYGLAGAVWSADTDAALAVARRLRTGAVDINGAPFNPLAPFGGYKQSGLGRELGVHGLAEFCELKAIQR